MDLFFSTFVASSLFSSIFSRSYFRVFLFRYFYSGVFMTRPFVTSFPQRGQKSCDIHCFFFIRTKTKQIYVCSYLYF